MSQKTLWLVPVLLLPIFLAACPKRTGAPSTAPAVVPAPGAIPAPGPEEADEVVWKDMSRKQKINHMKTVVVPKVRPLFAGFDAKKFAKVNCMTCHGKGAKRGKFKMPNPVLPKLDPTNSFANHKRKWVKFMAKKLVPAMLAVLPGVPRWNPKTRSGFGCGTCHLFK